MTFHIFERVTDDGRAELRYTGQTFSLAGHNLLYKAWERERRPMDKGWNVRADKLIQLATSDEHSSRTRRLVIDVHPKANWRIDLIELVHVYAYTYRDEDKPDTVKWTPLMLRTHNLLYEEREFSPEEKRHRLASIPEPQEPEEGVEFLYLNGDKRGWNWGANGRTNAAFIDGEARKYFRQFF